MAFQLAVFDVAGTTVLDGNIAIGSLQQALWQRGVDVPARDVVAVMGLSKPHAIAQLLTMYGDVSGEELRCAIDRVYADFKAVIKNRYRTDAAVSPAPGALGVFASLRRAGIQVALDTSFSRDILTVLLDRVGWRAGETFDISIASDEVSRGRPHPDLIHCAMARAGVVRPEAVVKVGDTEADLLQGLAARCGLVVGVTYGTHTRADLEGPDVHVIDALPALLPLLGVGRREGPSAALSRTQVGVTWRDQSPGSITRRTDRCFRSV